jgi:hypothetical protein
MWTEKMARIVDNKWESFGIDFVTIIYPLALHMV